MKLYVVAVFFGVQISPSFADFFSNFIQVSTAPPESYEAAPKCGEGVQKDKFKCVPYYNCDPFTNTIVNNPETDGSGLINPRKVGDPQCWHYLQVCCQVTDEFQVPSLIAPPTISLDYKLQCGSAPESEEFPWAVTILDSFEEEICGGSIISPVAVLTAAHCLELMAPEEIRVRTGNKEFYQEQKVSQVIMNEHYLESTLYNDVAILILNSSLSNGGDVGTVCLPFSDDEFDFGQCFTSKKKVSLISRNRCQELLRTKLGAEFILNPSFTCTDEDNCYDKGGDALVCLDSSAGRYFQVGIASWDAGCDHGSLPGVYSNVSQFRNWIDYKMGELGYYDSSYYSS